MRVFLPAAALTGALVLSGCGIKGPLYLPGSQPKSSSSSSSSQIERPSAQTGADHNKPTTPAGTTSE
ncbi:hypothetical protein GPA19_16375 [Azoarcus indigens]|uniref:Putative lipoprotein n=2 Tax=Azoarcus indigens TaxID=29545 RepID=A0A4R6E0S4_9RHOO|nr:hypothetical protein [Azoarcus indigens]TDN51290.1 putative lipoprotein [Azoarcus indigens]